MEPKCTYATVNAGDGNPVSDELIGLQLFGDYIANGSVETPGYFRALTKTPG